MNQVTRLWRKPFTLIVVITTLLAISVGFVGAPVASAHTKSAGSCQLNSTKGAIQHVIYIQFDNTHFTRDNPNVPSDLEQMPHLLNFIENNGVLLSNHHTPLIAHTATDILTSITGVYGDRHGIPVSNAFGFFNANGTDSFASSFAYWTDKLSGTNDSTYEMLSADGKNAPAPWVPYTRAGCNFGAVGTANIELENTRSDITTVFGPNSPEATEAHNNPTLAQADFVGIAIHCAAGDALCSNANNGEPDVLPDEPRGYTGFNGLFGHKYVAPQISPSGPLKDLDGNIIQDPNGNPGFPGFNGMEAPVSLAYVAAMQEHGVPVTYAYISDAHDQQPNGPAFGPGQAGYVAALKSYDDAFGKFFTRLANDGINQSNTLFVFTADEGDHFVGGPPSPANCDGVTTPCTYSHIGELDASMPNLLASQQGITAPFDIHSDAAPTVYVTGNPARTDALARSFERATGQLTVPNPITGQTGKLTNFLADPVEMKLLHMVTADPARTPTFTLFADPNYFVCNAFSSGCPTTSPFVTEEAGFAWNHGDVAPEINTTWLGMVGPGVQHIGVDSTLWSDHTDIRPTMLALLGLQDDYAHDGRVLFEDLYDWAVPQSLRAHRETLIRLAQVYKQINACVGQLGLASLVVSTRALESGNSSDDSTYTNLENKLMDFNSQRDALAAQMSTMLEQAAFHGQAINEQQAKQLISQGQALLDKMNALAA